MSTFTSLNISPTITSLGVGSGLDLNSIVTSLVAIEQQPITQLQAQASVLQTEISDFGQISSLMSALESSATALRNPGLWTAQLASSSNSSAVSATAGSGAVSGNYEVTVDSLAAAQTLDSGTPYSSSTDLVGSGTLTLQLGSWNSDQSSFTAKSGSSAVNITVSASDTLDSLVSKINSMGMGVTASLVSDANGVRMALTSTSTGAANGFRVQAADSDGNNIDSAGLSAFAFDPPSGTDGMHLATAAANAIATINGIDVSSASNTITGAVYGLSITLGQKTSTAVNIAVNPDKDSISSAIDSFVSAFNGVAAYLETATKYDSSTQVAGDLQGNSAANSMQTQLRNTLNMTTGASSVFKSLTDVGIRFQRDGTVSIDQPTLTSALTNLPELKKAFATIGSNSSNNGFATNFFNLAMQVLGPSGLLTTAKQGLQTQLNQNSDDQATLNNHVAAYQQTLLAQYSALDQQLGQLNGLSSYVSQQIAALNSYNSKN
jgi:flagellar hook-associated protein 2